MANLVQCNLGYSLKNIPVPDHNSYLKSLIHQTENFIRRLRWRVFWYENKENKDLEEESTNEKNENFGLKTNCSPPPNHALSSFEGELYKMISNIKFSDHINDFQDKMAQDLKRLKASNKIIVEADKTTNLYQVSSDVYKETLLNNITKDYKLGTRAEQTKVNDSTRALASKLKIDDKLEKYSENQCFITYKDIKKIFTQAHHAD